MKSICGFFSCVLCGFFAGCASPPPRRSSPDVDALKWVAYDVFETASMNGTRFHLGFQLREDPEHRRAVETLLTRHAESAFWDYRKESGVGLLSIGSVSAWERGIELAQTDPDPRVRAALWERVALALDIGLDPSGLPANPTWHHAPMIVRPASFDPGDTSRLLLSALEHDEGMWREDVVDYHPFVPLYRSHRRVRRTVRDHIARALSQFHDPHPDSLRAGLLRLAEHENPDVARAAQGTGWRFKNP